MHPNNCNTNWATWATWCQKWQRNQNLAPKREFFLLFIFTLKSIFVFCFVLFDKCCFDFYLFLIYLLGKQGIDFTWSYLFKHLLNHQLRKQKQREYGFFRFRESTWSLFDQETFRVFCFIVGFQLSNVWNQQKVFRI